MAAPWFRRAADENLPVAEVLTACRFIVAERSAVGAHRTDRGAFGHIRSAESLEDFRYVEINFFAVALSGGS